MVTIDGLLRTADGWRRFDSRTKDDRSTVADTAENSAGMVGGFGDGSVLRINDKCIIVFGAKHIGNSKAVTDFKSFHRTDGKDGFCKVRIEFFEDRISDAGRDTPDDAFDDAACGITFFHAFDKIILSF